MHAKLCMHVIGANLKMWNMCFLVRDVIRDLIASAHTLNTNAGI